MRDNRELDREIAEKVMGWTYGTRDECAPKYRDGWLGYTWWHEGLPYADFPHYSTDPAAFWPAFEEWIKSARVGDGINSVYAKMEMYVDGSGHFGIYDFNTDKKLGYCETNPDPSNRVTLGMARCEAWLAAIKGSSQ